jgi:hypothetical protein
MAARGWKGYVVLALPFVAVLLFLSLVLNSYAFDAEGIREVSADEQTPYPPVIPTQPITHHDVPFSHTPKLPISLLCFIIVTREKTNAFVVG